MGWGVVWRGEVWCGGQEGHLRARTDTKRCLKQGKKEGGTYHELVEINQFVAVQIHHVEDEVGVVGPLPLPHREQELWVRDVPRRADVHAVKGVGQLLQVLGRQSEPCRHGLGRAALNGDGDRGGRR